jgi:hypothetical protein
MTVFGDPLEVVIPDPDHSEDEFRFLSMGQSELDACSSSPTRSAQGGPVSSTPGKRRPEGGDSMNQPVHPNDNGEIRPQYDFSHGVRGKHYEAYRAGTNVVFLDPDVARAFPDSASVNQALRLLLQLARTSTPLDVQPDKAAQPTSRAPRRAKKPKPVRAARG